MEYKIIEIEDAPKEVQNWLKENKDKEGYLVFHGENKIYVVITRGEVPTGGYKIELDSIEEFEDKVVVYLKYSEPDPGLIVIQVISYPILIIELDKTEKEIIIKIQENIIK